MAAVTDVKQALQGYMTRLQREMELPEVDYPFGYGFAFIMMMQEELTEEELQEVFEGIQEGMYLAQH